MGALEKAVWHLEANIDKPMTLADIAALSAVSPWHLVRLFHEAIGIGPMSYRRARRLTNAAKALAGGEEILPVALDAGYGSHEAFTRAFAACFGVLPSTVRAQRTTANLTLMEPLEMDKSLIIDVAPPQFRDRPAFRVIGLSVRCTFETNSVISKLWRDLDPHCGEVPQPVAGVSYGVCCDMQADGHFRYVAGLESRSKHVPDGLDFVDIPASRYAVFQHVGHIADFQKTIYTIWNKALPDAGLKSAPTPDFELYDERFDPATGSGVVEVWIPIA